MRLAQKSETDVARRVQQISQVGMIRMPISKMC